MRHPLVYRAKSPKRHIMLLQERWRYCPRCLFFISSSLLPFILFRVKAIAPVVAFCIPLSPSSSISPQTAPLAQCIPHGRVVSTCRSSSPKRNTFQILQVEHILATICLRVSILAVDCDGDVSRTAVATRSFSDEGKKHRPRSMLILGIGTLGIDSFRSSSSSDVYAAITRASSFKRRVRDRRHPYYKVKERCSIYNIRLRQSGE